MRKPAPPLTDKLNAAQRNLAQDRYLVAAAGPWLCVGSRDGSAQHHTLPCTLSAAFVTVMEDRDNVRAQGARRELVARLEACARSHTCHTTWVGADAKTGTRHFTKAWLHANRGPHDQR